MRKSLTSIFLIYALMSSSVQSASAVYNGSDSTLGLAVKILTINGSCTGVIWREHVVITAAHCVFDNSGTIKRELSANIYYNGEWRMSRIAGIRVPTGFKNSPTTSMLSQEQDGDIAFLILENKILDNLVFPNLRLATSTDWETYRNASTGIEIIGYGPADESKSSSPNPISGFFAINSSLSYGVKDWGVIQSTKSSVCYGDSGGPVIYYRANENALVLVGVIKGVSNVSGNCGASQGGIYTGTFTLVSTYSYLSASTDVTENKYRIGKDVIDQAWEQYNTYSTNSSDIIDFYEYFPAATQKKVKNNINVINLDKAIESYRVKVDELEQQLKDSMDFAKINSVVLEANSAAVGINFEDKLASSKKKIDTLLVKVSKIFPAFVCSNEVEIKDMPSNKKCPKGYTKTELTKPF